MLWPYKKVKQKMDPKYLKINNLIITFILIKTKDVISNLTKNFWFKKAKPCNFNTVIFKSKVILSIKPLEKSL